MAEQLELTEQTEQSITENMDTLTPSTSNPSDNPLERSPSKKKTAKLTYFLSLGQKYSIQNLCLYYKNKI